MTEIPRYDPAKSKHEEQAPCWVPVRMYKTEEKVKPYIVCNCGARCGIGLHHVHADGTVTASFWHKKGNGRYEDPNGCEWHVHLKLLDYDWGDFPPRVHGKIEKYSTQFVHYMPQVKEPGILYISHAGQLAIHLCACGCGAQVVCRLAVNGLKESDKIWGYKYHDDDGSSTLNGSILQRSCKSHYHIERGLVRWC